MKSEIKIKNTKGVTTIDIEGTIGVPEEWQFDEPAGRVATYDKFQRTLAAISRIRGGEVVVNIRSTGGDVGDALLIHEALGALEGASITTRCHGYVASAATIIAQAASAGRREISASSLYLIHNSVARCEGNADDLRQSEQLLSKTDERIAALYAARSGRTADEMAALMAENNGGGRWLSPEEALAEGLADRIIDGETTTTPTTTAPNTPPGNTPLPSNSANFDIEKERHRRHALDAARRQRDARPTELKTTEDPPLTESRRSANQTAYTTDAGRFFR